MITLYGSQQVPEIFEGTLASLSSSCCPGDPQYWSLGNLWGSPCWHLHLKGLAGAPWLTWDYPLELSPPPPPTTKRGMRKGSFFLVFEPRALTWLSLHLKFYLPEAKFPKALDFSVLNLLHQRHHPILEAMLPPLPPLDLPKVSEKKTY